MGRWIAALVGLLWAATAAADDHLVRAFDARSGFDLTWTTAFARDARGFAWIGTPGGLLRYDGYTIEPWARSTLDVRVFGIYPAADNTLYAISTPHLLWHVVGTEATLVDLPNVTDALAEPDGAVWAVSAGKLWRRDAAGRWNAAMPALDHLRLVRRGPDGALWIASSTAVWRIDGDRAVKRIDGSELVDIRPHAAGVVALQYDGVVLSSDGSRTECLYNCRGGRGRGIALARRGDVTWVAYDSGLVALRPKRVEEISRDGDIPAGGGLFVDTEGSLWVTAFQALLQLPEPDTSILGLRDGLPAGVRRFARTDEGMWVSTWFGLGRIDRDGRAHDEHEKVRVGVCLDHAGRLWAGDETSWLVRIDGRFEHYPVPNPYEEGPEGCASAFDGGVWLTRGNGLWRAPPEPGPPVRVEIPDVGGRVTAVGEDRHGRLWLARGDWGCWTDARAAIRAGSWTCRAFGGATHVTSIIETEAGHVWASAHQVGVLRFDERTARWQKVPGNAELASHDIYGLTPSPRGGTWLAGSGVVLRVLDRPDLPAGWEIVEAPGIAMGLYKRDAEEVFDDPDGALWITQSRGVHFIPRTARDRPIAAPTIALIAVVVDGRRIDFERGIDLASGSHQVELEVSALALRDPSRVRYRVRLSRDRAWSAPARQPSFRFVDLPAGHYDVEAESSLDGTTWSEPVGFHLAIERPWYLQWWAIAGAIAIVAAAIYAVYRVRLAMHLRLERQRSRIAMDLHDEMGSGLGSIGILAELASEHRLDDRGRTEIASNIAETAEELSDALGEIVWSLRERSATLDALVAHVRERASRLFAAAVELTFDVPAELPATPVSLAVRSNVPRIAFEALHNAARHAAARRIAVAFARTGARWRMTIEDDGVGLTRDDSSDGLGLTSMRKRAEQIGAQLAIETVPTGGTRIELVFVPGADS